ncbi:hypothetical protein AAVH_28501 [Aphelenchoides avenae]|nr:hypothetical protein AAVH_28501 [Aphelenchus avenae]
MKFLTFVLLVAFALYELEAGPLSFCCCPCKDQGSSCQEPCPQPCRRRCQQPCQSPCQQPCADPCQPFPQPPQPFPCPSGGGGAWPLWGPTGGGCGGRKKRDVHAVDAVRAIEASQ